MPSALDKFQRSTIGSGGRISDYTARISAKGDFSRITDLEVILSSWNNILLTPKRTYDHDPEYGSSLYEYIFDPLDDKTNDAIKQSIARDLMDYDNRADITDIIIKELSDRKGISLSIYFTFEDKPQHLGLTIDEQAYFNFNRSI